MGKKKICFSGSDAISWVNSRSQEHNTRVSAITLLQNWMDEGLISGIHSHQSKMEDDKHAYYAFVSDKRKAKLPRVKISSNLELSDAKLLPLLQRLFKSGTDVKVICAALTKVSRSKV